jgi:hypothetical protein
MEVLTRRDEISDGNALGGRSRKVGPDGHPVDRAESWKPNLGVVREILRYVESTSRLDREIRM